MIEVRHITKSFSENSHSVTVLKDVSFDVPENKLTIIEGKSGSGKTTLLNIISGFEKADEGSIEIDGEPAKYNEDFYSSDISYVIVDNSCINSLTVEENFRLITDDKADISDVIDLLNLKRVAKRGCNKLSKGEQVRVAIGMSLLKQSKILLLDEPTANLDVKTSELVFKILTKVAQNKTVIVSTHDKSTADKYGDFLIELDKGVLISAKENPNKVAQNENIDLPKIHTENKTPFYIYSKIAIGNSLKHIPTLLISSLLLVICFFCTFVSIYLNGVDEARSLAESLNYLEEPFYEVTDNRISDHDDLTPYLEGSNFKTITLDCTYNQLSNSSSINVAFKEDLDGALPIVDQFFTSDLGDEYQNSEDISYYPMCMTDTMLKGINDHLSDINKPTINIGDIVPYVFRTGSYKNHIISFVLTGIIYTNKESDSSLTDLFPAIIEKSAYEENIRYNGIHGDSSVSDSLLDVLNGYKEYATSKSQEVDFDTLSFNGSNYMSPDCFDDSTLYDSDDETINSVPGKLLFYGNRDILNSDSNWVLLPAGERDTYPVLASDKKAETWEEDFYKQYYDENDGLYHYPLNADSFSLIGATGIDDVVVAGVYECVDGHPSLNSTMLLSPNLYDELMNQMLSKQRNTTTDAKDNWYSLDYLKSHVDDVVTGAIDIKANSISEFKMAFSNAKQGSRFAMYVAIVILVVSLAIEALYVNNLFKSLKHDFSVLTLNGKKSRDKLLISFLALSPSFILSLVISLIISAPLGNLILSLQSSSSSSFSAHLASSNIGLSFSAIILVALGLWFIFSGCSLLIMKKKSVFNLKQG